MSMLWSALAHSGVGWFNDILTLQLVFEADLEEAAAIPFTVKEQSRDGIVDVRVEQFRSVFAAGAHVGGVLRVTAPPGRSIPHSGITLRLESGFYALEEIATRDLYEEALELVPAGVITASVDFPFLFRGVGRAPLHESYEGDLFSIRHAVTAVVLRPWYTFEVSATVPFAVQRVYEIAAKAAYGIDGQVAASSSTMSAAAAGVAGASTAGGKALQDAETGSASGGLSPALSSQLALYTEQSMVIDDLSDGGRVVMTFDKGVYEVSDHLRGTLAFTGITVPILLVRLAVVRIEYADGEVHDSIIFDDSILDARRWRARKEARARYEVEAAADIGEGVEEEEEAAVDVVEEIADADDDGGPDPPPRAAKRASSSSQDGEEGVEVEDASAWMPTAEDFDTDEPDSDLPLLGDTSLSVDLDFAQVPVTPTYVIDVTGPVLTDPAAAGVPPPGGLSKPADADNEVSVRYFLRITVYTSFDVETRRWNASEVILYRDHLYGSPVPRVRQLLPLARIGSATSNTASAAGGGSTPAGGDAPPVVPKLRAISTGSMDSAGATSPHVAALATPSSSSAMPQPASSPFTRSLFGMHRSPSGREVKGVLTPKGGISGGTTVPMSPLRGSLGAAAAPPDDDVDAESGLGGMDLASAITQPVIVNAAATRTASYSSSVSARSNT